MPCPKESISTGRRKESCRERAGSGGTSCGLISGIRSAVGGDQTRIGNEPFSLPSYIYFMRKLFALFFLAFLAHSAFAQTYGGIPEKFYGLVAAGKTAEAVDYVYSTNPWLARKTDQAANLKAEFRKLDSLVGKYLYHEPLVEEKVGTRYVHLIHVVGYERQPLRFEMQLYRAATGWVCQGISFDAKLDETVEKAANQAVPKH